MRHAKYKPTENSFLVDTNGLKDLLQSGRDNSVKIGIAAGARVQIGKSVRWNVEKVKQYIEKISGQEL